MTILSRDALLKVKAVAVPVDCPEVGGEILVRPMSATELLQVTDQASTLKEKEDDKGRAGIASFAQLAVWCVVDSEGNQVFTDPSETMALPWVVLERLGKKIHEISVLTKGAGEAVEGN
jgi:hypothetical protein